MAVVLTFLHACYAFSFFVPDLSCSSPPYLHTCTDVGIKEFMIKHACVNFPSLSICILFIYSIRLDLFRQVTGRKKTEIRPKKLPSNPLKNAAGTNPSTASVPAFMQMYLQAIPLHPHLYQWGTSHSSGRKVMNRRANRYYHNLSLASHPAHQSPCRHDLSVYWGRCKVWLCLETTSSISLCIRLEVWNDWSVLPRPV